MAGFLNSLLGIAGAVIGGIGDAYAQEVENRDKQASKETFELLQEMKNKLKIMKNDFKNLMDYEEIETEEEFDNAYSRTLILASVYKGDVEAYRSLTGIEENSERDRELNVEEELSGAKELVTFINAALNLFMDENDSERDFFTRAMERFLYRIYSLLEEIEDAETEEDLDVEDIYNRMQKAVSDFRSVLNKTSNIVNDLIEECFEDME